MAAKERWQAAPGTIRGAIAVQAGASVLVLALVAVIALREDYALTATLGGVLLLGAVLVAIGAPLALWLLRRSAIAWTLWLVFALPSLASGSSGGPLGLLGTVLSLVTVGLLLAPASCRWAWADTSSAYAASPDVRRPD